MLDVAYRKHISKNTEFRMNKKLTVRKRSTSHTCKAHYRTDHLVASVGALQPAWSIARLSMIDHGLKRRNVSFGIRIKALPHGDTTHKHEPKQKQKQKHKQAETHAHTGIHS